MLSILFTILISFYSRLYMPLLIVAEFWVRLILFEYMAFEFYPMLKMLLWI